MKKKTVKTLLILLLISAAIICLASCSSNKYYDEIKPTKEEARSIATLSYSNTNYDVTYDLFRTFYLTEAESESDFKTASERAMGKIAELYSIFYECERVGIDTDSSEIMKSVDEYICASVDGGKIDGVSYNGYGSHEAYLEAIKKLYMTDRVNRLLVRSYICENKLVQYYTSSDRAPGDEAVRNYFNSDDCIKITWFSTEEESIAYKVLSLLDGKSEDEIIDLFITYSNPSVSAQTQRDGWYIGRYEISDSYRTVASAAFSTEVGSCSKIISDNDGNYYIVYRMMKDNNYLAKPEGLEKIRQSCAYNDMYKKTDEVKNLLISGASYTDFYSELAAEPSKIKMG